MDAWASPWADGELSHDSVSKSPATNDSPLQDSLSLTPPNGHVHALNSKLSISPLARTTSNPWADLEKEGGDDYDAFDLSTTSSPTTLNNSTVASVKENKLEDVWTNDPIWGDTSACVEIEVSPLEARKGFEVLGESLGGDWSLQSTGGSLGGRDTLLEKVPGDPGRLEVSENTSGGGQAIAEGAAIEESKEIAVFESNILPELKQGNVIVEKIEKEPLPAPVDSVLPSGQENKNIGHGEDDDFGDFSDTEAVDEIGMQEEQNCNNTFPLSPVNIVFDINTSLIENLYPSTLHRELLSPVGKIVSTISARKAWYRMSREGPMAKYNSGDGDDYIRVTWAKSAISKKVNEIIERWVSEGRFVTACGVVGSSNYGAMFGWGEGSLATGNINRLSMPTARIAPVGSAGHKHSYSLTAKAFTSPVMSTSTADFGWGKVELPKHTTSESKQTAYEPDATEPYTHSVSTNPAKAAELAAASAAIRPASDDSSLISTMLNIPNSTTSVVGSFQPLETFEKAADSTNPLPLNNGALAPAADDSAWASLESFDQMQSQNANTTKNRHTPILNTLALEISECPTRPTSSPSHLRTSSLIGRINVGEESDSYKRLSMPLAFAHPVEINQIQGTSNVSRQTPHPVTDPWDLSFFEEPPSPKPAPVRSSLAEVGLGVFEEESKNERVMRELIEGLPDLTYMLS